MVLLVTIFTSEVSVIKVPSLDMRMPGAKPVHRDSYLCSSFDVVKLANNTEIGNTIHVTGFIPVADPSAVHHMLLFSCSNPVQQPGHVYDCVHHNMCKGPQSIMYAWAKSAPSTHLPSHVSFTINPAERQYLVLQVHYAHPHRADYSGLSLKYQMKPTRYSAGIFILLRAGLHIPPNTATVHGDINCRLPSSVPLTVFAFRTHAHSLSTVITGYVHRQDTYAEIARGSPQWPQTFYPTIEVNGGGALCAMLVTATVLFSYLPQSSGIKVSVNQSSFNLPME